MIHTVTYLLTQNISDPPLRERSMCGRTGWDGGRAAAVDIINQVDDIDDVGAAVPIDISRCPRRQGTIAEKVIDAIEAS